MISVLKVLWRRHGLGDLSPHGGDLQPTCAKRPAHKRIGDRDFLLPSAAQRVQLRTNTAQRVLGGVRRRVFACASSLIIESGSLSVALSPEETAGGVAGSASSTVYTIMAIKLRVEAQHNIGGQLAWSLSSEY